MTTNLQYITDRKSTCGGCQSPTRGHLVMPDGSYKAICPRCRDTHSMFKLVTGLDRKEYIPISSSKTTSSRKSPPKDMLTPPMLARALKDVKPDSKTTEILNSPSWVVTEKYDGNRLMIYLYDDTSSALSRNITRSTGDYGDKSGNVQHLELSIPDLNGTVIDGEVIFTGESLNTGSVVTTSTLSATSALLNCDPIKSQHLQKEFGYLKYVAFDITRHKGQDVRNLPLRHRYLLLRDVILEIQKHNQFFSMEKICAGSVEQKEQFYLDIITSGGEGVMYKDLNSTYCMNPTSRPVSWVKRKTRRTVDGFITDFTPGEAGFAGMVGALEISVYNSKGEAVPIAMVSNLELQLREQLSNPEGNLKDSYYGQVVEVEFQELTERSGRGRHATLLRWRPDKSKEECTLKSMKQS